MVVIDDYPINCARKTLDLAGLTQVEHLVLHRLGLHTSDCRVTEGNNVLGVEAARATLPSHPR